MSIFFKDLEKYYDHTQDENKKECGDTEELDTVSPTIEEFLQTNNQTLDYEFNLQQHWIDDSEEDICIGGFSDY